MLPVPRDWPKDVPLPPPIPRWHSEGGEWIASNMAELRRKYPNKWVAVYDGEVIAAGDNLGQVERLAHEKTGKRDIATDFIAAEVRYYSGWRLLPD